MPDLRFLRIALACACLLALFDPATAAVAPGPGAKASTPTTNTRLLDTRWALRSVGGQPAVVPPNTTAAMAAHLVLRSTTQHLDGHTGCNHLKGRYTQRGTQLATKATTTTRKACSAELMAQEQRFLSALAATDGYRVEGRVLSLLQGDAVTATFEATRGH